MDVAKERASRFWSSVDMSDDEGCWPWTRCRNRDGYGRVGFDGDALYAHRVAYTLAVGPIPEGLQLDHLCRNRACCNPSHLEPVNGEENSRRGMSPWATNGRKEECVNGHPFTAENTRLVPRGGGVVERRCRECARATMREQRACPLCGKEGNRSTVRKHMRTVHPEVAPGAPTAPPSTTTKEKP